MHERLVLLNINCFELHLLCKTYLTSYQVLCDDCLCTNTIVPQEMMDGVLVTLGSYGERCQCDNSTIGASTCLIGREKKDVCSGG